MCPIFFKDPLSCTSWLPQHTRYRLPRLTPPGSSPSLLTTAGGRIFLKYTFTRKAHVHAHEVLMCMHMRYPRACTWGPHVHAGDMSNVTYIYLKLEIWHVICYMLHVTRDMLHVTCYILHGKFEIWHVTCYIWNLKFYIRHVTCYMLHVTYDMLHVIFNMFLVKFYMLNVTFYRLNITCYVLHITCYMQHVTCYMLHVTH